MDLLVKSYHQLSATGFIMVLNGLNFEFSSFINFVVNLRTDLDTRYFKSNDDIGADTLLKSTVGTDNGTFLKK